MLLGPTGAYWILLEPTGPYWTLLDLNGSYWTVLDPTGPYWTLLDPTGPYWTLLDPTGHNWILLDPTAPYWTLLDRRAIYCRMAWAAIYLLTKLSIGSPDYVHTCGRTYPQKLTNHFSHPPQKRPEIFADLITRPKNPGTFVRIPQKVVGHFLAVPTVVGSIFWAFLYLSLVW